MTSSAAIQANGLMSPPQTEKAPSVSSPPRVVLAGKTGRILCVADIRGDYHELNKLIRLHEATAVIHTGDFGFINSESLDRMGDKILRHLLQYSPLLPSGTRASLLAIPPSAGRAALVSALSSSSIHFPLSQFPHLLSGAINFPVPVFTVWGLIEDVRILERFRTGEYEVHNLHVIDESLTKLIDVGGVNLRLFGLGGAVAQHKMFDNGEGFATIAGGQGTMWTTALQIGELVDTAQRVYDPTETRLFVCSAPISRNGLLSLLTNALKADLTISGGLHFRYPSSFNEFGIHPDLEAYQQKLKQARSTFMEVYASVKDKVDSSMNEYQQTLLKKAISAASVIPSKDDTAWTNTWHWVLSDASCGHLLFSIVDGRVTAETKSAGLNFGHRATQTPAPPSASFTPVTAPLAASMRPPTGGENPTVKAARVASTGRPPAPSVASGVPPRPSGPPTSSSGNPIRGFATRPPPSAALRPPPQSEIATNGSVPVPAPTRPPTGPKQGGRGGGGFASQAMAAAGMNKDKPADSRPDPSVAAKSTPTAISAAKPPAPPAPKNATPTAHVNGKSTTPAPNAEREKEKSKLPSATVKKAESAPNGTAKQEKVANIDKKQDEPKTGRKDEGSEAGEDKQVDEGKEGHTREESTEYKKKPSLYIKGIPVPSTEEELRALFPDSGSKITAVKIISDRFTSKQRDYAYVDFDSDESMQAAVKSHGETIRDTTVNVSISNPPKPFSGFGGRGRGGFRGVRGGRSSFSSVRRQGSQGGATGGGEGEKKVSGGDK